MYSAASLPSSTTSPTTPPKVPLAPSRLLHHEDLPSQRLRKGRDLRQHAEEGLEPGCLVDLQHPGVSQVSAHRPLPRKRTQRGGRQTLHGQLPGVLQTRQTPHRALRHAQGAQVAGKRKFRVIQGAAKAKQETMEEEKPEVISAPLKKENDNKKKWMKRI